MKYSKKIWKSRHFFMFSILLFLLLFGCKKLVEVDSPINNITGKEIYNSNSNAISVLTGIYIDMSKAGSFTGLPSITLKSGLSSDEFIPVTDQQNIYSILYNNSLSNNGDQLFWTNLYSYIFRANAAIEGVTESSAISEPIKKKLIGEAKFLRAFMYFYLVNLYGDVPLLTSTEVSRNSIAPRTNKSIVYQQIISDLKAAQESLSETYVGPDLMTTVAERTRPNISTATALLSRVYLFLGQWQMAEQEATKLISNGDYQLESIDKVFVNNSLEAIWQIQPTDNVYRNTLDGQMFILLAGENDSPPIGPNPDSRPIYLSDYVFDAFSNNDLRKSNWIGVVNSNGIDYHYPSKYLKYKNSDAQTEFLVVFRLAEQYLIRAEARTKLGNISSGLSDLNIVRKRANLQDFNSLNEDGLFKEILEERKRELFSEWGHRWLDLKRTGEVDRVMTQVSLNKGGVWSSFKALYPIPIFDILTNPQLRGHQNLGYPEN